MIVRLRQYNLLEGNEPPESVLVLPLGETDTSHGVFTLSEQGAKAILDRWAERDRDMGWDYEHQTFAYPPIEAPASAWCKLELRDDGIHSVNTRWTERADKYLRAGEYRYWSPVLLIEEGEVADILNVALTNFPATRHQTPLMPFSEGGRIAPSLGEVGPEGRGPLMALLKAAYGEIAVLVEQALEAYLDRGWVYIEALYDDTVVYRDGGRFRMITYSLTGSEVSFDGVPVEVERIWREIPAPAATPLREGKGEAKGKTPPPPSEGDADLRGEVKRLKAEALLRDHARKISPAISDTCRWLAEEHPERFTALMRGIPAGLPTPKDPINPGAPSAIEFSAAELAVYKQTGVDLERVRALRQKKEAI